eukprot:CAMPEP_0203886432 /NCGR_PEP_ID=MMETSP0359-20131031/30249_1 /ASSEMBLY_ACC=CAM_ASM_000338 /TAXON_ID=268821 /ORGANISM="Scrippsiella Hangoei, Strain SHTV-5" /LENGTH=621 /DNA_ID=CAMNT_0050807257 /DNA_START=118 /DNA_END=1983 /DNA_ORIENTATION=-
MSGEGGTGTPQSLCRGTTVWSTWSRIRALDDVLDGVDFSLHGEDLHKDIPPARWCVNKADLRRLRRQVRRAINVKKIVPTLHDAFDPYDTVCGPTIYTVNEQFITPITAEANNMSWALMRHPEGLQCDIFITHAWQEGIFEFLDKVLASWPRDAKAAWCCMLANPQNLGISDLIRNPACSPFALALVECKYMLVVANSRQSIYTRLWCAYEAYLAHRWNKVILTAAPPISQRLFLKALAPAVLSFLLGAVACCLWPHQSMPVTALAIWRICLFFLILFSSLTEKPHLWHACNAVGILGSAFWVCLLVRFHHDPEIGISAGDRHAAVLFWGEYESDTVAELVFFLVSEFDRMRFQVLLEECDKLKKGYKGSILNAQCSCADDATNIWAEIGDQFEDVDRTIGRLIRAGMSAPDFREACDAGVDLHGFAMNGGLAVIALQAGVTMHLVASHLRGGIVLESVHGMNFVLSSVWLINFYRSLHDARIFSYMVLQRFMLIFKLLPHMIFSILVVYEAILPSQNLCILRATATNLTILFAAGLSVAGMGRTVRLPYIGRCLTQFLVARGRAVVYCPLASDIEDASDAVSDSGDGESGDENDDDDDDDDADETNGSDAEHAPSLRDTS